MSRHCKLSTKVFSLSHETKTTTDTLVLKLEIKRRRKRGVVISDFDHNQFLFIAIKCQGYNTRLSGLGYFPCQFFNNFLDKTIS